MNSRDFYDLLFTVVPNREMVCAANFVNPLASHSGKFPEVQFVLSSGEICPPWHDHLVTIVADPMAGPFYELPILGCRYSMTHTGLHLINTVVTLPSKETIVSDPFIFECDFPTMVGILTKLPVDSWHIDDDDLIVSTSKASLLALLDKLDGQMSHRERARLFMKVRRFLEREKTRQVKLKVDHLLFSDAAKSDGVYKGKERPFCLPLESAKENLFQGIRESTLTYFADKGIKWHDGREGNPSNHLCDSQVCCVNFLAAFSDNPTALADLLQPVFPDLEEMLPIENKRFVAFEWIGRDNYLGERVPKGGKRTRGANCTSVDAAAMFKQKDGKKHIALIEWKYTESYNGVSLKFAHSRTDPEKPPTDRTKIYAPLFERDDCPIDKIVLLEYDALFFEPFYQFFRQQLLAHEMEKAHELSADIVSILHIAPAHNFDFRRITSRMLGVRGDSATEVWKMLLREPSRFQSFYTENLFPRVAIHMPAWWEYVSHRYPWITGE